ncbi:hypothetical protein CXG81DRAFT_25103 [Caulochytrium protostelioides]|uniref:L domain-like protein n=1 Tax=Caulochytrium protostelioides TaxID=1555241 RepID=A0A4P9XA92_9FUNG|nr:hypothetical protein CXG81DRAFT_25103 [Caulochytrium protostelioides]|eukprot:RKP02242.1 hypothetical protein CXG81DRAFT_25103 [Caulochytrium protostelioides]
MPLASSARPQTPTRASTPTVGATPRTTRSPLASPSTSAPSSPCLGGRSTPNGPAARRPTASRSSSGSLASRKPLVLNPAFQAAAAAGTAAGIAGTPPDLIKTGHVDASMHRLMAGAGAAAPPGTAGATSGTIAASTLRRILDHTSRTGRLALNGRGLAAVPAAIFEEDAFDGNAAPAAEVNLSFDRMAETDASAAWWERQELAWVNLADNVLTTLPSALGQFERLTTLDVRNNRLSHLPDDLFERMGAMKHLYVSNNALTTLPTSIGLMPNLVTLMANANALDAIPASIGGLASLQVLDLAQNRLAALPSSLSQLGSLQILNAEHNALQLVANLDFSRMRALRDLNLAHNQLADIFETCMGSECQNLAVLNLNSNRIHVARWPLAFPALREVHLSANGLHGLPGIRPPPPSASASLSSAHRQGETPQDATDDHEPSWIVQSPRLQILILRDNALHHLPDALGDLRELVRLDVSNNAIARLPPRLGYLPALSSLLFAGNFIKGLPTDSTVQVLKVLRERDPLIAQHTAPDRSVLDQGLANRPGPRAAHAGAAPSSDRYARRAATAAAAAPPSSVLDGPVEASLPSPDRPSSSAASSTRGGSGGDDAGRLVDRRATGPYGGKLSVAGAQLVALDPAMLDANASMSELDASANWLTSFPTHRPLIHLRVLNLERNRLTQLPLALIEADGMMNLPALVELNLAFNLIETLPDAPLGCRALRHLSLANNKLTQITPETFEGLETLDLANNSIASLPPRLGLITSIRVLRVDGNTFRMPRRQILDQGTDATMAYLRDRIPR